MRIETNIPLGLMPCPDPDCPYRGESEPCLGRPEDFGETTEPEACEGCGQSDEELDWKESDKAWICPACGFAHVAAGALQ